MTELWQGSVAPTSFDLSLRSAVGGFDFTTVLTATIEVALPTGTLASWPATLVAVTTTSMILRYVFNPATDVPLSGRLVAFGRMVTATGYVESDRAEKMIRGKWEVP